MYRKTIGPFRLHWLLTAASVRLRVVATRFTLHTSTHQSGLVSLFQPRSHSISSNRPSQPDRSRNRPNHHPPSRNSNLLICHPHRKLPCQKSQRIQAVESENPRNPKLDRRLHNPRQRAKRCREGFCGEVETES